MDRKRNPKSQENKAEDPVFLQIPLLQITGNAIQIKGVPVLHGELNSVEQIHAVDRIAVGDSNQPRSALWRLGFQAQIAAQDARVGEQLVRVAGPHRAALFMCARHGVDLAG